MHLHIEYGVMLVYIIYGGFIIFIYLFIFKDSFNL